MKRLGLLFVLSLSSLLCAAQSQNLPELAWDQTVKCGTLPNGVSCYFVPGSSEKGLIRIALVQKKDPAIPEDKLSEEARECFSNTMLGRETRLADFLPRNGYIPSVKSYISVQQGSISYDFNTYSSARGEAVLDSTLFGVMNLSGELSAAGNPTTEQAVIMVGDFDLASVQSKLNLLSLSCSKKSGKVPAYDYKWDEKYKGGIEDVSEGLPHLKVEWHISRMPDVYLKTVFPAVSDVMAGEFAKVLSNRLYPAFIDNGLSVWIDVVHTKSTDRLGDETITLYVYCARSVHKKAAEVLKCELDKLATRGIDETEYVFAKGAYKNDWLISSLDFRRNDAEFVSKCKSAFLFGANIAKDSDMMLFAYRQTSDDVATGLFNKFLHRLLMQTSKSDHTLPKVTEFQSRDYIESVLSSYQPKVKLKIKKQKDITEYVSGGNIWTLPNGIKLVYKKMDTKGISYFTYAVRGGRKWADPDYLSCIDGVNETSFNNYLAAKGMHMEIKYFPTDIRLSGIVPDENFETLLMVISALSAQKENEKVFGPDNFKIFVLASDFEDEKVIEMFENYAEGLGPGVEWRPCEPVENIESESPFSHEFEVVEYATHLDISSANKAKTEIAHYCLKDALIKAFSPYSATFLLKSSFEGFPTDKFKISIGILPLSGSQFALSTKALDIESAGSLIWTTICSCARNEVTPAMLNTFKTEAKNAFAAYKSTPRYYLDAVCDRYLDNRDLVSHFDTDLNLVTASDLKTFFQSLRPEE